MVGRNSEWTRGDDRMGESLPERMVGTVGIGSVTAHWYRYENEGKVIIG
jgi:hypothetical protein